MSDQSQGQNVQPEQPTVPFGEQTTQSIPPQQTGPQPQPPVQTPPQNKTDRTILIAVIAVAVALVLMCGLGSCAAVFMMHNSNSNAERGYSRMNPDGGYHDGYGNGYGNNTTSPYNNDNNMTSPYNNDNNMMSPYDNGNSGTQQSPQNDSSQPKTLDIGESATFGNAVVTVKSVTKGPNDSAGKPTLQAEVTFTNNNTDATLEIERSFWSAEKSDGTTEKQVTIDSTSGDSILTAPTVAPGKTITLKFYFENPDNNITGIEYAPSVPADHISVGPYVWTVK